MINIMRFRKNTTNQTSLPNCKIGAMRLSTEFRNLPIFQGLTEKQIKQISRFMEMRHFPSQKTIFWQGEFASYVYILLSGKVAIRYKPYDGEAITISNIIPGWVFGWSAALGRTSYTSGAVTLEDCKICRISKENIEKICLIDNETGIIFLQRLTTILAERINPPQNSFFKILTQTTAQQNQSEGKRP